MSKEFGELLRYHRERCRLSMNDLAGMANCHYSIISRWEAGTRQPTRRSVVWVAEALTLDQPETDALLIAAGFMPDDPLVILSTEPTIVEAIGVLRDRTIPAWARNELRALIASAVRMAEAQRPEGRAA